METIKWWLKNNYLKLIIIILGLVALGGLFLPYERSIGEYREKLQKYPDMVNIQEVDFKNSDVIDISIMENFKVYQYAVENSNGNDWLYGESLINIILTITLIVSTILVLIFAIFNKKVLTIIFDVILAISSLAMNYDIVDRGVIPSSKYTYGISYYLYIIIAVIILICSIILIIKRNQPKPEKPIKSEAKKENIKKQTKNETKKDNKKSIETKHTFENIVNKLKGVNKFVYISILLVIIIIVLLCVLLPNNNSKNNDNNSNNNNNSSLIENDNTDEKDDTENEDLNTEDDDSKDNTPTTIPSSQSGNESNVKYNTYITDDGEMIIIATNNNKDVVDIEFEIEYYDKSNKLVGSGYADISAVSKNSRFALDVYDAPKSYDSYKVYVDVEETDNISYLGKLEATHNNNKDEEEVIVQVKNTTDKEIEYIGVSIVFYKDNKIVGYDDSLDGEIKSGRSANFTFSYPYDESYDTIYFDEYQVFINEAYTYSW